MRNPALIAIAVLCSFMTGCTGKDTGKREVWPDDQPRLSIEVKPDVHPGDECVAIGSQAQAIAMLMNRPACIDNAIVALQRFAERDAAAMSNLAAAYYIRAKRKDRPSDLLLAFHAADHAAAARPQPAAAPFNLALCEKALGLSEESLGADWSPDRLSDALRSGNAEAVTRLIKPYPTSAQRFLEDRLLPQRLAEARLLATQLVQITSDRYVIDEVNAVASADAAKLAALKDGYATLAGTRAEAPGMSFKTAAEQLRRGGSPAALYAEAAAAYSDQDLATIDALEKEARRRGYLNLVAYVLSARGYVQLFSYSRYIESLTSYDAALAIYERLHDPESVATAHTRRAGLLRVTGQLDAGWREALATCLNQRRLGAIKERNLLLGETAALASALGEPHVALLYANNIVRLLQKELAATPPEDLASIRVLQHNMAVARRRRASYELQMGQYNDAGEDLDEAMRLGGKTGDQNIRQALEARHAEVLAQTLLHIDATRAVAAFTRALALSKGLEYRSFRASLYAQRAAAERLAGKSAESEQDLRSSLAELRAEESELLARRKPDDYEKLLWSSYFSRFQETYGLLIRRLIEDGRVAEAFEYADRERAFEPLNLELKLNETPGRAARFGVPQIQEVLPAGTFLIEYSILEDQTLAWIISRDQLQVLPLQAGRSKIERWSATLQRSVPVRDLDTFDTMLFAAYDGLMTAPMATIRKMPNSASPRLVIVPDGAMYGIPFAALRNPITRLFLIQDAPVSMAGSAALYALSVRHDRALKRDVSALLIGNPQTSYPLRGAEKEATDIAAIYAPHAVLRTGAEATVADFIARAGESAIVHIAAHAVIDPQTPSRSALLFAASKGDSGKLDAAQLLTRLKLDRTRLVVLSACSSAGGLPVGPQGVGPLVRPLIARGAPAVIGTLWDIEDATAGPLLVSFHQHYREGNDAAVAMQLAQIELLRNPNPGLQSVLVWAPFQVIGYSSSPFPAPRK